MIGARRPTGVSMFPVFEKMASAGSDGSGHGGPKGVSVEVGCATVHDCWGRGYATEGAAADGLRPRSPRMDRDHSLDRGGQRRLATGVARKLGSRNLGPRRLPPLTDAVPDIWGQTRRGVAGAAAVTGHHGRLLPPSLWSCWPLTKSAGHVEACPTMTIATDDAIRSLFQEERCASTPWRGFTEHLRHSEHHEHFASTRMVSSSTPPPGNVQ